jgi:hypothetical protein
MGYRSQVRCLIYGTKENLEAYITEKALIDGSIIFTEFRESLTRYTAPWQIYHPEKHTTEVITAHILDLYGDSWKWYEGYEDVDRWMKFMREAAEAGLQYEFIRIGEDDDDTEQESSDDPAYFLGVTRSIYERELEKGEPIPLIF